jgi:hypothetical protein
MYRSTFSSVLAGGEWSASHPGRFTPEERAPGTHWIGGWVDPRARLDAVEKRKFLTLLGSVQPVESRYTDCGCRISMVSKRTRLWKVTDG